MLAGPLQNRHGKPPHRCKNSTAHNRRLPKAQKAASPIIRERHKKQHEAVHKRAVTAQVGQVHAAKAARVAKAANAAENDVQAGSDIEDRGSLKRRRTMARRLAIVDMPVRPVVNAEETVFPSCKNARVASTCYIDITGLLKAG